MSTHRNTSLLTLFLLICFWPARVGIASEHVTITPATEDVQITILESNETKTVIRMEINAFDLDTISIDGKQYYIPYCDRASSRVFQKSAPDLPEFILHIIIPDEGEMAADDEVTKINEYADRPIAPSKGALRLGEWEKTPFEFGEDYRKTSITPIEVVTMGEPFILRDLRGIAVHVRPFQYDPANRALRVNSVLTVTISRVGSGGMNVLRRRTPFRQVDRDFNQLYQRMFINYERWFSMLDQLPQQIIGPMLIITADEFTRRAGSLTPPEDNAC